MVNWNLVFADGCSAFYPERMNAAPSANEPRVPKHLTKQTGNLNRNPERAADPGHTRAGRVGVGSVVLITVLLVGITALLCYLELTGNLYFTSDTQ